MKGFSLKRLTLCALLAAVALIIFVLESKIPNLAPIPGMKLGLANIVTVWSMFALGPVETLMILLIRIVLGSVFAGSATSFFFSFAGGTLCYLTMLLLRKILTEKQGAAVRDSALIAGGQTTGETRNVPTLSLPGGGTSPRRSA